MDKKNCIKGIFKKAVKFWNECLRNKKKKKEKTGEEHIATSGKHVFFLSTNNYHLFLSDAMLNFGDWIKTR